MIRTSRWSEAGKSNTFSGFFTLNLYPMKKAFLALAILTCLAISCTNDNYKIDPDNAMLGTWVNTGYQEDMSLYSKSSDFSENPCYKFNADGTMVERMNSGWCGTPPISYGDYSGTWSIINENTVRVNVTYWGGTRSYKINIRYVSPTTLKVTFDYDAISTL
jgi:hypothetical protein